MADGNGNAHHISPLECSCAHGASYDKDGCSVYKKDKGKNAILFLQDLDKIPRAHHEIIKPADAGCGNFIVKWGAPSSERTIFHEPLPGDFEKCSEKLNAGKGTLEITFKKKDPKQNWMERWQHTR